MPWRLAALVTALVLALALPVGDGEHERVRLMRDAHAATDARWLAGAMRMLRHQRPGASSLEELTRQPASVNELPCDPWGRAYVLRIAGPRARQFVVVSAGADGVLDTADDVRASGGR